MTSIIIKDSRFGNRDPIALTLHRYADNNNLALRGTCAGDGEDAGEPWCTYSVNMGEPLPADRIAIKNWSENVGVEEVLAAANIIEFEPIDFIQGEGFASAPVYMLTDYAKREFGLTIAEGA